MLLSRQLNLNSVWIRLNAFISQKSVNTQKTYLGVLNEWVMFLGAALNSEAGALAILSASEIHVLAYREMLLHKKGQPPRYKNTFDNKFKGNKKNINPTLNHPSNLSHNFSSGAERFKILTDRDGSQETLTDSTIVKKLSVLRRLYQSLLNSDIGLKLNPFASDDIPRMNPNSGRKRPTEMIDYEKVQLILSLPNSNTPKGLRDKAILALLFGAGLRRSELVNIRLGDFLATPRGTPYLALRATKAKIDARLALPDWATTIVDNYRSYRLDERASIIQHQEGKVDEQALFSGYLINAFVGHSGKKATEKPISVSSLYNIFKMYCFKGQISSYASPHSARATAITRLLDDGYSHRQVQSFSRHASVQMVEVYDKRRSDIDDQAHVTPNYENRPSYKDKK